MNLGGSEALAFALYCHLVATNFLALGSFQGTTHLIVVCGVPQESPKGDGVGDAAEVDKQDGRDGLNVEAIIEVTWEPRQFPFDIQTQPTKEPAQDKQVGVGVGLTLRIRGGEGSLLVWKMG